MKIKELNKKLSKPIKHSAKLNNTDSKMYIYIFIYLGEWVVYQNNIDVGISVMVFLFKFL